MVRQQRRKMVAVIPPTTTLSLELCLVGLPLFPPLLRLTPLTLVMVTRLADGMRFCHEKLLQTYLLRSENII